MKKSSASEIRPSALNESLKSDGKSVVPLYKFTRRALCFQQVRTTYQQE